MATKRRYVLAEGEGIEHKIFIWGAGSMGNKKVGDILQIPQNLIGKYRLILERIPTRRKKRR